MEIRVTEHGRHVAVVTIDNQPRLNAMTRAMMAELARHWDELERGPCRCIVLTGAGSRAFCTGADISGDLSASVETARVVSHALLKYDAYSKPIVAAVNGDCVGGGVELLLATDIRAAAPHARFGLPEVKWSIYPFGGATVKLPQQIGHVHAMDLLLTGRLVDAAEAARLGLINRIVPAEGGRTPLTTLKHVVLPAPFGPISPTISPCATENVTFRRAFRPPKRRLTWSTSSSTLICASPTAS